jgi:hypothetical protein
MKKAEENLKPTYEDARVRAYDRLVADHDRVPQYYLAVIGSTLLANMSEEEALEAIREFLESPVGEDYVENIRDTEDP